MTIRSRLLYSIGALAMGYILFFAMVKWTDSGIVRHLNIASDSLVPATSSVQIAQAGFERLNKSYKDAVMLQNASSLQNGNAAAVADALRSAAQKLAYNPELQSQVTSTLADFTAYSDQANGVYGAMISNTAATADAAALGRLDDQEKQVNAKLAALREAVGSTAYKVELEAVTASTHIQEMISVLLFLCAMLVGGIVVWIVHNLDQNLRRSAVQLREGSDEVNSAAIQLASSSEMLAKNASQQAAMIEETSAAAEEIRSMAKRNSECVQTTSELVVQALQNIASSNQAVAESVASMEAIGQSTQQIGKIIDVIDRIAFQTDILALNAAVEAARAGEAGMGFAVVADEVRSLAHRCAQAAQETNLLIKQSFTNTALGSDKIKLVVKSGGAVNDVFTRIRSLMDEVGQSSQEQGRGIEQIGRTITRMEKGTQEGAANAQESANSAQHLDGQSNALRTVAGELGAMVGVQNGARYA